MRTIGESSDSWHICVLHILGASVSPSCHPVKSWQALANQPTAKILTSQAAASMNRTRPRSSSP